MGFPLGTEGGFMISPSQRWAPRLEVDPGKAFPAAGPHTGEGLF
jgi:hypothetical protein